MEVRATVIYAKAFTSPKTGKEYTKLYVIVGQEVVTVIAAGNQEALTGVGNVRFTLACKQGVLKLYYNGEEE